MALRLLVSSVYPDRSGEIKAEAKATIDDLKAAAGTALKLNLSEYRITVVSFGEDAESLDKDAKFTLKESSTLVFVPPAHLLPSREVKSEDTTTDARFAGYRVDNIFQKLGKARGAEKKIALEYLDFYSSDIVKHSSFLKLPKSFVINIVKRDSLLATEVELFDAVVNWAKTQLKAAGTEATNKNVKEHLKEITPYIRFTLMTTEEVAAKVTPTEILESEQVLELFTFLAQKEIGGTPGPSLSKFNHKAREGSSRYGPPGSRIRAGFTLTQIDGQWSYGSADHVNTSDRVVNSDLKTIENLIILNTTISQYKASEDNWNFPRGMERCGIYTYPHSDPHALELEFTKGPAIVRSVRWLCTRLEGGVRVNIMGKARKGDSWGSDLMSGNTLPVLTNGGNQKQWVEIRFAKFQTLSHLRIEIRGGQCAFHAIQFEAGP